MGLESIAIVACSNGLKDTERHILESVVQTFTRMNVSCRISEFIFQRNTHFINEARQKAEEFNSFLLDSKIEALFDISGGDAANLILPYIDFRLFEKTKKPYFGISDNTVLLNAIVSISSIPAYHYFIRNAVGQDQLNHLALMVMTDRRNEINFPYYFLEGHSVSGEVVGGNLRCFLKTSCTKYFPVLEGKILFLESLGGDPVRIASYLTQIKQMRIFDRIKALLLGTFTQIEEGNLCPGVDEMVCDLTREYSFPIVRTKCVGHSSDSKVLPLGVRVMFREDVEI